MCLKLDDAGLKDIFMADPIVPLWFPILVFLGIVVKVNSLLPVIVPADIPVGQLKDAVVLLLPSALWVIGTVLSIIVVVLDFGNLCVLVYFTPSI